MSKTPSLENPAPPSSNSEPHSEAPPSFSTLVARHTVDLPGIEWLTRLSLDEPRDNVLGLPLSFRILKRLLDIIGALALLVMTLPIMLVAALLIKLTSPGPAIYSQTRVGLNLRKKNQPDRRWRVSAPKTGVSDRRSPGRDRRA